MPLENLGLLSLLALTPILAGKQTRGAMVALMVALPMVRLFIESGAKAVAELGGRNMAVFGPLDWGFGSLCRRK